MKQRILKFLSSLELAIACLVALFILTVIGTLAQVKLGIYFAVEKYFNSYFITWNVTPDFEIPVFPGALLIGWVLMVNLVVSHFKRFKLTWDKLGIWLTHFGIVLLIVAGGLSTCSRYETQMAIEEGQRKNFSENSREMVIDIVDQSRATSDTLVSFPSDFNQPNSLLSHEALPFTIEITDYYPNSKLIKSQNRITSHGLGQDYSVAGIPISTNDEIPNLPAAYVNIKQGDQILGNLLLSGETEISQKVPGNETFLIALRPKRVYYPFFIELKDFIHLKYPGTKKPSHFESFVTIHDAKNGKTNLEANIYMNHPLRYGGHTFYQASYDKEDTVSVFQVVRNPSWLIPYISSIIISIGLLWQFGLAFLKYRRKAKKNEVKRGLV